MNLKQVIESAEGMLNKEAENQSDMLQQALAKVAAQGYSDTIEETEKSASDANAAEQAAMREVKKDYPMAISNAMQVLSENEHKPGHLTVSTQVQEVPAGGGGGEEKMAELDPEVAATLDVLEHIKVASVGGLNSNEKVACFACNSSGCGVCDHTGSLKLAEADEIYKIAEACADVAACTDVANWVNDEMSNETVKTAMDAMEGPAIVNAVADAQDAVDSSFTPLIFNRPQVDVPDFGGQTEEYNPLLNMLKPRRTTATSGE